MKITLPRAPLLQLIQRCQSIVEKRHTVPILANVLIGVNHSGISMTATDLEVGIRSYADAIVDAEGSTTVSAKKLFDIIKELDPEKDVTLEMKAANGFLSIVSGLSRFRIATQSADEYPDLVEQKNATAVKLPGKTLADMIGATSFAMSTDETRKYLTGTLFELDDQQNLRLVTTDGHRLALSEASLEAPSQPASCIVPKKAVLEIRKLCEENQGEIELLISERQIRLVAGSNVLTSKLIDVRFPVYQDVIPVNNPDVACIEKGAFDQVLRRNMIVANEFTHDIRLTFSAQGLDVSAHNTEQEQSEERIVVDYSGHEIAIGFNGRYLRDVLGAIRSSGARMEIKDELSPVLIRGQDDDSSRYVIMPMRI